MMMKLLLLLLVATTAARQPVNVSMVRTRFVHNLVLAFG